MLFDTLTAILGALSLVGLLIGSTSGMHLER